MYSRPSEGASPEAATTPGLFVQSPAGQVDAAAFAGWLYRGARALSEAATPTQVVEAAAREARAACRAAAVAVIAVEQRTGSFRPLHVDGLPGEMMEHYRALPRIDADPVQHAAASGTPVFVSGPADLQARYPARAAHVGRAGIVASATVPVCADGVVVAALDLFFAEPRTFSEHDHTFLMTMTEMLGQALQRTWLLESEQNARVDAQAANRAKTEFLAVMSHELRTPLNAIIGYAQILGHGIHGELNAQQHRDVERVQHSARHLLALLNHVIGFAQLERDHVLLELGAVSVNSLLEEVQMLVSEQVHTRSQRLIIESGATDSMVRGDRDKLGQVLLNLLVNATRHTPVGGTIHIRCERDGERLKIHVEDSGVGIPADQLERIFEPFVQLDRGLTGKHEGAGLGLAIGRELTRRMGGDLHAERAPDRGARFIVTLPLWLSPDLDPQA